MAKRINDKKQALQARKEEILKELKYYEKRIDEARNVTRNRCYYENDSSDSEQEFALEIAPSITELKLHQSMLKTCLHATQELTGVEVLQSEVNVLVNNPVFEGEPPITEVGTWREVLVECRVDLVPFSMTFNAHQSNRLFAPVSYRNLQITPVKIAHELELDKSVLSNVRTPSDAVEVIRNYARAHRCRRSSLARLAEKYGASLFMEPAPEGGFILKCANLLEISWTLQNKWSPIAQFHHKMKFDLEYMDETRIKIIIQAHKQLADPDLETDERTLLLAKIINTCLEAEKLNGNQDKDGLSESVTMDSELMAPPKSLPKKVKPNDTRKRSIDRDNEIIKKTKIDKDLSNTDEFISSFSKNCDDLSKNDCFNVNDSKSKSELSNEAKKSGKVVVNDKKKKNNAEVRRYVKNVQSTKDLEVQDGDETKKGVNTENESETGEKLKTNAKEKKNNNEKNNLKVSNLDTNDIEKNEVVPKNSKNADKMINKEKIINKKIPTKPMTGDSEAAKKSKTERNCNDNIKENDLNTKTNNNENGISKKSNKKLNGFEKYKEKASESSKLITKTSEYEKKSTISERNSEKNVLVKKSKTLELENGSEKNINKTESTKNLKRSQDIDKNIKNTSKINKKTTNSNVIKENIDNNTKNPIKRGHLAERFQKTSKIIKNSDLDKGSSVNGKTLSISKVIGKKNGNKASQIPQKRLSDLKKNPLRISPRKPQAKLCLNQDTSKTSVKSMQKTSTNIPILIKKPATKPKI